MIRSFRCSDTERLFRREPVRRLQYMATVAPRKLRMLDTAEALAGDRRGRHSIRINSQWLICFAWRDGDAREVEIVDHH